MQAEIAQTRSESLARQFEQINRAVIEVVESCTQEQWRAVCPGEGWTVGVVAYHIAWAHGVIVEWVRSLADGRGMPPLTMPEIDAVNAENAVRNAGRTPEETLELLRAEGAAAAALVRSLHEDALDRSGPIGLLGGRVLTVEQLIQAALLGHPSGHLASIQGALEAR